MKDLPANLLDMNSKLKMEYDNPPALKGFQRTLWFTVIIAFISALILVLQIVSSNFSALH